MEINTTSVICKHWTKNRNCKYGANCKFTHPPFTEEEKEEKKSKLPGARSYQKRNYGNKIDNSSLFVKCFENYYNLKNLSKATIFRKFLIDTFGKEKLKQGKGILDVAGGQSELSFQFLNLNGINSTIIDPRPYSTRRFKKRYNFGIYHKSEIFKNYIDLPFDEKRQTTDPLHFRLFFDPFLWRSDLRRSLYLSFEEDPNINIENLYFEEAKQRALQVQWTRRGLKNEDTSSDYLTNEEKESQEEREIERRGMEDELNKRETQIEINKREYQIADDFEDVCVESFAKLMQLSWKEVQETLEGCSVVIGLHPDQATEYIVDFALQMKKPFAIIPCCTYSNEFPKRKLPDGRPVKKYEELIQYLQLKNSSIKIQELDFEGKNKVLFWIPDDET